MYSDISNAEFFRDLYKNKVCYCKELGGWFIYNGKTWDKDTNDNIKRFAMDASKEFIRRNEESGINKDLWWSHAKKTSNNSGLNAMIDCAKAFLCRSVEDFDKNGYYFNCFNVTYDIKNLVALNHDSRNLITRLGNVEYKEGIESVAWLKFINEISLGRKPMSEFLQKVCGYCLTDDTSQQCLFILYGSGRNGKSVFLDVVSHILGDYSLNCPSDTFIETNNLQTNGIARLKGSRLATAVETNQNVTIDEKTIKNLTGKDKVTARFLNKEFFDFTPTFKIFIATNNKPNIRGTDDGIWRRIRMIPFDLKITDSNDDRGLSDRLKSEASGILNWMIDGYKKYLKEGLNPPDEIKGITELYREEEDDIGQFIKDECVKDKDGFISVQDFKIKFKEVVGYHKSQKIISQYMERTGFKKNCDGRAIINGKQVRGYSGLRWATAMDNVEQAQVQWQE